RTSMPSIPPATFFPSIPSFPAMPTSMTSSVAPSSWAWTSAAQAFAPTSPRKLGHPWGGMHSTVDDLGIVLQMFLNGGVYDGQRILGRATLEAMTTDQNKRLGH